MAKRQIIKINEKKCNGCGQCVPNCPEGAIQIIDKKARLVSDLFCDGLGACIGHCPQGAITIEKREAEPYDEKKVMLNIVKQGDNTIKAHIMHLKDHGQTEYFNQAVLFLKQKKIKNPLDKEPEKSNAMHTHFEGCPGSRMMDFSDRKKDASSTHIQKRPSALRQWPIQLHLVSPNAPYYQKKDLLLAADCTAFALGNFHDYLEGKSIAIACPKLDSGQEVYEDKLVALMQQAKVNTITIMIMQVPCCSGLVHIAQEAREKANSKVPIKTIVIGIDGSILSEEWV